MILQLLNPFQNPVARLPRPEGRSHAAPHREVPFVNPETLPTVVLVHGAWADGSSWRSVMQWLHSELTPTSTTVVTSSLTQAQPDQL